MKWYYIIFALQTVACTILGIYCLYKWTDLFKKIQNTTVRNYCKVVALTVILYSAFMPGNLGWPAMAKYYSNFAFALAAYLYVSIISMLTYFIVNAVSKKIVHTTPTVRNIISFCMVAFVPFSIDIIGQLLVGYSGKVLFTNISYSLLIGCCAASLHLFLSNYSKKKEVELAAAENLKIQAQLNALQAKINPHFLYNALSGLAGLALEDGRRASKMATALSHWFRYSLNKQERLTTTVIEEMDMVENYIAIEKIRFEDAIDFIIDIDKESEQQTIPIFLIQPLIENTLKHAFKRMNGKGIVTIRISYKNNLSITVEDNGLPFEENMQMGYGLQSIQHKLQLLYANKYELLITNAPTKNITITIFK